MTNHDTVTSTASLARRLLAAAVVATTLTVWFAPVTNAAAQSASLGLILLHSDEGVSSELARFEVDAELVGLTCELTASVDNQRSVNPGNDVYVSTGGDQLVLTDVEALAGHVTSGTTTVVAGETVVFTLIMGPGKVFSGKLAINLDCQDTPVVTTTTSSTTTTSTTTTTTTLGPSTAPTTVATVPTEVKGEVEVAPPAQPVPGQPTFTG